ncbi:hypothetical protein TKK_0007987 [Trichogramma kaykai]
MVANATIGVEVQVAIRVVGAVDCSDHYKFRKAARGCSSPDRCSWKNFDDEETEKGQGGRRHKNNSNNIKDNPDKPSAPKNSKPS